MDSLIVKVIQRYHPEWQPPHDNGYEWVSTLCPFHGETNRSASVSFTKDAFHCFACPVKGDPIAIIRYEERNSFAEAKSIAEGLSEGGYVTVSQRTARQPRQRLFADEGIGLGVDSASGEPVQDRIRW
jgi:DNA primase